LGGLLGFLCVFAGGLGSAPAVFAAVATASRCGADELAAVAAVSDLRGGWGNGRGRHVVRERPDGSESREVIIASGD